MSKKYKTNRIPWAVTGLLCLALLSAWMIIGLSARFSIGATESDEARVAAFDVTESSTMSRNFTVTMEPGESRDITVRITNSSETTVSYTIAFELEGNLPLTVVAKDGDTSGTMAAASDKACTFQLKWDPDKNNYQYAEGIESITVEITAVQED